MSFDVRIIDLSQMDGGGEKQLVEQVRKLPNDYVSIVGCVIGSDARGQSEQYDMILIGPPGIFVFEVKNWAGEWTGDSKWWFRRTERRPSPIQSARRKRDFLRDWLRAQGLLGGSNGSYWIDYAAVLTNTRMDTARVVDPGKDKYLFRLHDISDDHLNTIFRLNSAKRIEGYYEARRLADKIAPESAREVLAVDFGTSYSLVGMYTPEGSPHIFADAFNSKLIPSVFGYQDRKEYVGRPALNALAQNRLLYRNYIASVKTLLGLTEDEFVRLDARAKPQNVTFEKGNLVIRLDRRPYTAVEVAAKILGYLREIATTHTGRGWTQAVISVPARFNHEQRTAVYSAAKQAGFEIVSLIDEPTAAALAFGLVHKYDGCVAVYDLGGGTFDFSVVEISRGACRERVKLGRLIGGDDFDLRLVSDCKRHFRQAIAVEMFDRPLDREEYLIQDRCEQAKINLSGDDASVLFLDNWRTYGNISRKIDREEFAVLIKDLIDRTFATCEEALSEAGNPKIDDVLLVGDSTFIPLVRERVREFFGVRVRSDVDANTAIVHGAAIKAGILMGRVSDAMILTRLSPVTIGIPMPYPFAVWSNADRQIAVEPIKKRCSDENFLDLRRRLLELQNSRFQNLDTAIDLIKASGVPYSEITEDTQTIFLTERPIMYPLIGRNEQIECDGEIVDFEQTFPTTGLDQPHVSFRVLEAETPRNTWLYADECRVLEERTIRLTQKCPAGENGLKVAFRMDRDGRLQIAFKELANVQNSGIFVVDVLYRDHGLPTAL